MRIISRSVTSPLSGYGNAGSSKADLRRIPLAPNDAADVPGGPRSWTTPNGEGAGRRPNGSGSYRERALRLGGARIPPLLGSPGKSRALGRSQAIPPAGNFWEGRS